MSIYCLSKTMFYFGATVLYSEATHVLGATVLYSEATHVNAHRHVTHRSDSAKHIITTTAYRTLARVTQHATNHMRTHANITLPILAHCVANEKQTNQLNAHHNHTHASHTNKQRKPFITRQNHTPRDKAYSNSPIGHNQAPHNR